MDTEKEGIPGASVFTGVEHLKRHHPKVLVEKQLDNS